MYVPDTVESLDTDGVLLDSGVSHGDPPAEDLGDVPHPHVPHVPGRLTQSPLLLDAVLPDRSQLVCPVLDCIQCVIIQFHWAAR